MGVKVNYSARLFLSLIVFSMHLLNFIRIEHIIYFHGLFQVKLKGFVINVLVFVNKYSKAILD